MDPFYFDIQSPPGVLLRMVGSCDLAAGSWQLRRALNVRWTFYMNDRDGAWIAATGGRTDLPAGRLVLVPGSCAFDAGTSAAVRHLFGYFDLDLDPTMAARLPVQPVLVPADPLDGVILGLSQGIPDHGAQLALVARLALAVGSVLTHEPALGSLELRRQLTPALHLIRSHYAQVLSQESLARACGMSVQTFARRFHQLTGSTAVKALRKRRVDAAARLLGDTDQDLDTIAQSCGLTNRAYLIRVFRAVLGMTPGDYRRGVCQIGI